LNLNTPVSPFLMINDGGHSRLAGVQRDTDSIVVFCS
jgi:hypothetical protein